MKVLIIIVALQLISPTLKADYDGYRFEFSIETINGHKSKGYVDFPAGVLTIDSLKRTENLKEIFNKYQIGGLEGNFTYYKEKINYDYIDMKDSSFKKQKIYHLTTKTSLSFKLINRIIVNEIEKFNYCIGTRIANELKSSDTTWLTKDPIGKFFFAGYFNSYQIFIHENADGINEIIKQLEIKQKEINSIELITDDSGYSENGHKMDQDLLKLIQKLNKRRVVIINKYDC